MPIYYQQHFVSRSIYSRVQARCDVICCSNEVFGKVTNYPLCKSLYYTNEMGTRWFACFMFKSVGSIENYYLFDLLLTQKDDVYAFFYSLLKLAFVVFQLLAFLVPLARTMLPKAKIWRNPCNRGDPWSRGVQEEGNGRRSTALCYRYGQECILLRQNTSRQWCFWLATQS
jgi:hypothetical protein